MLYEQTHQKLIAMKLFGLAAALKDRLERRDHQDLSKTEFLGLLVDDEWIYRENRKLTARLKVAKFKLRAATIESIDYATPRGLRKEQILELTQNRWLRAHETLLINGPSGSGKSFLAQALGQHACRSGFPVQYLRMPALLTLFVQARAQGTYDRLLKRFGKIALLIIDDFGLASLTEQQKQDLLETIEERYGTGSTIITSQLPVADWHEYLGGGRAGGSRTRPWTASFTTRIGSTWRPRTPCASTVQTCPMPDSLLSNRTAYVASLRGLSAITGSTVRLGRNTQKELRRPWGIEKGENGAGNHGQFIRFHARK